MSDTKTRTKTIGTPDDGELRLHIRKRSDSRRRLVLRITHDPDIEIEVQREPNGDGRVDELV